MKATATLRDCLYLNWAIPRAELPSPPESLSYELHPAGGTDWVLASAVVFHQQHLAWSVLPWLRFTHPQASVRLYVQDEDGMPAVWFRRMVVPPWLLPGLLLLGQPAAAGRFESPPIGAPPSETGWGWRVQADGELRLLARPGASFLGPGPKFSSWEALTTTLRYRPRGYSSSARGLVRIDTVHPRTEPAPVSVEISRADLVSSALGVATLPPLHSAFLCGEVPMLFELAPEREPSRLRRVVVAADTARRREVAPEPSAASFRRRAA